MRKKRFLCAALTALLLFAAASSALAAVLGSPALSCGADRPNKELIDLDLVLNTIGGSLHFETSEYPFTATVIDGRIAAVSGNAGVDSSFSSVTLTLDMLAGETLSFDYKCSTEYGGDIFTFSVNGQTELLRSGEWDWGSYTYTAAQNGSRTFVWKYQKDYGMSVGSDCCWLDEIVYSGDPGAWLPGDANGNGEVSVSDALLTMRFAMGLIGETELIFNNADIDSDGRISISDALLIMRIAMGL